MQTITNREREKQLVDLHVHSNISDGANSPAEIIEIAVKNKVKVIALTDHDSIEGIREASIEASRNDITLINGIEMSAVFENRRIHILGLGIDIASNEFLSTYNRLQILKDLGITAILKQLEKQGIVIDIRELRAKSTEGYLNRYDIYRYFMRHGICNTAAEVWEKYIDPIPFATGELLTAAEAISTIKNAGGLSFLAHFHTKVGFEGCSFEQLDAHIGVLVDLGLDGIEEYYPSFGADEIEVARLFNSKYDLLPCGGTDFHGENRPNISLGKGDGNMFVPYAVYENIREALIKRQRSF